MDLYAARNYSNWASSFCFTTTSFCYTDSSFSDEDLAFSAAYEDDDANDVR